VLKFARLALAVLIGLAALPASAEDVPTLNIYTYDSFAAEWGPGPQLKAGFEKTCGCVVEFTAADSAIGALRRVQLEGATTTADIILGLDTSISGEARATGLFAPHGLDLSGLTLPVQWTDAEFVPFDYGYFAFVYDTDTVGNAPNSFEELIAEPESFKIAIEDPRSDTPGLGLVLWIKAAYGDRAPEIWAGLKPHILTMARGWSEAYGLFLKGEVDMVLSYTTSPAYHLIAENDPSYNAAVFTEGHYPQVEVAGILKSSHQQDLAQKFLTYLTSVAGQKIIPTTNWMYPVTDLGADLPPAFASETQPTKVLQLDEAVVTKDRNAWIEEALAAIR
jgi:thiamine transport system substrate-binding protein